MTLTLEAVLLVFILILSAISSFLLWQSLGEIRLFRHELESLRKTLSEFSDGAKRSSKEEQAKLEEVKNSIDALRRSLEESIRF
ncbi:MAG: hypothetical protein NZM06_08970 [Chloroherpetonaceae bacterium]|nr:hypothetical protein [Chloroherpetonaceae bacterium]MDW8437873.1 hypothetical protein [Chloroherpetonaceae bacterium]